MPTNTVHLDLATYNATTDSQSKFISYRTDECGVNNSNMTKIDAWAGTINSKLTILEGRATTILVDAAKISMGYFEATTSEVDSYKLNMLITFKFDADCDGTTTIKINELAVKSLMKYAANGTVVNLDVGDLRKNHEYQFRYDGTRFVWQYGTSSDQLNIQGNENEIVGISSTHTPQSTGVTIGSLLQKKDVVNTTTQVASDGKALNAVQANASVEGTLANQMTLLLPKSSVVNTTTETVIGKALDATQANPNIDGSLAKQINVLNKTWKCDTTNLQNSFASVANTPAFFSLSGNLVTVNNMLLIPTNAIVTQGTTIIGNIPTKYRPLANRGVVLSHTSGAIFNAVVTTYGTIFTDNSIGTWIKTGYYNVSFSYAIKEDE